MVRMMEDGVLVRTVFGGFPEDIPNRIEALKGCLDSGDVPGMERQAHTIKGASANVGGETLRAVAFEMEKAAKAGDLKSVAARLPELENQFARLKDVMNEFIHREPIAKVPLSHSGESRNPAFSVCSGPRLSPG
jgi:HPt (histidine-containing phosphotransfer) domain-containing protein